MSEITKIEHNLQTGEVKEVKLTAAEVAEAVKQDQAATERAAAEAAKATAKAALLAKLGIDADEAKLLLS
jgi:hypothetical protein